MNKVKIELKRLAFFAYHGATEEEARLGQRFYLDVTLRLIDGLSFVADDVEETVNYAEVYEVIQAAFTGRQYQLIERAAETVCDAVMSEFSKVAEITVRVEKPSAPVDCICEAFAVEIVRCR